MNNIKNKLIDRQIKNYKNEMVLNRTEQAGNKDNAIVCNPGQKYIYQQTSILPSNLQDKQFKQDRTLIKMTSIINKLDQYVFQKIDNNLKNQHQSLGKQVYQDSNKASIIPKARITYSSLTKQIKKDTAFVPFQQKDNNLYGKVNKQLIQSYEKQIKELKAQKKHLLHTIERLNQSTIQKEDLSAKVRQLQASLKGQIVINLQLQKCLAKMMEKKQQEQKKRVNKDHYFKDIEKKYNQLLKIQQDQKTKNQFVLDPYGKTFDQPTRHQTFQSTITNNPKNIHDNKMQVNWNNMTAIKMNHIEGNGLDAKFNVDDFKQKNVQSEMQIDLTLCKGKKRVVHTDRC